MEQVEKWGKTDGKASKKQREEKERGREKERQEGKKYWQERETERHQWEAARS